MAVDSHAFGLRLLPRHPPSGHLVYTVALLAGITLCGEKEVWAKAQQDVLAIADKMHEAMKDRGAAKAADLSTVTTLFTLAAVFPTPASPILAGVGTVLTALESLLNAGSEPTKPTVEFAGVSPEDVIGNAQQALKKLAETIRGVEHEIESKIKEAMTTVTSRTGSFDLPKPALLEQTQIDGMEVDLNYLATETLPQIERQLCLRPTTSTRAGGVMTRGSGRLRSGCPTGRTACTRRGSR